MGEIYQEKITAQDFQFGVVDCGKQMERSKARHCQFQWFRNVPL